jgi:Leucine-rich repeat (LRR) protein
MNPAVQSLAIAPLLAALGLSLASCDSGPLERAEAPKVLHFPAPYLGATIVTRDRSPDPNAIFIDWPPENHGFIPHLAGYGRFAFDRAGGLAGPLNRDLRLDADWSMPVNANGDVTIEPGREALLDLSRGRGADLRSLRSLPPGAVQHLRLGDENTTSSIRNLAALPNLRDSIRGLHLNWGGEEPNPDSLRELIGLKRLQMLVIDGRGPYLARESVRAITELKGLRRLDFRIGRFHSGDLELIERLGSLERLDLPFVRLNEGADPPCLSKLDNLRFLRVSEVESDRSRVDTTVFGGMEKLETLEFSIKRPAVDLAPLADLPSLRSLTLELNYANSASDLPALRVLTQVRSISLSLDTLSASHVNALAGVENLTELRARSVDLDGPSWNRLAELISLERLSIYRGWGALRPNQPDYASRAIAKLPRLRDLTLHQGRLPAESLEAIAALTPLESLALVGVPLNDDRLRAIAGMKGLKTLILGLSASSEWGRPTSTGYGALAALPALETLALDRVDLGAEDFDALAKLAGLRSLYLGPSARSGNLGIWLSKLPALETLYLVGVKGPENLEALAAHPALRRLHLAPDAQWADTEPFLLAAEKLRQIELISLELAPSPNNQVRASWQGELLPKDRRALDRLRLTLPNGAVLVDRIYADPSKTTPDSQGGPIG